ncbi:two-component system sensor histidine kinase YesM [Paenibacillus sp. PastF-1]|uniref:sensor histidine kinase n=3 Tax=Paenibacillus TaxID=44249 RepID=UPI0024073306|nr:MULTISPECIES: histidine kinase [unclassified Paenibacillus]MDF9843161.1 two-component system sensor histidine kinase YesM [Paenibacillus sp. PastF-2]MDF9849627.1 two-component system sensor histidine kinase YesM [Paenibacillus sp. PastM-2]MDF9856456.1 two-component system sensor histidine kinase YesM [Paenibacillus sp. PastF-1]MDH6481727.1 two-component system sensor histidine kinase YesM [Paenibacillus sp. PastH-2]MDH6509008.1 two-component system sensor histidine kinase YesM [Paenibacillu
MMNLKLFFSYLKLKTLKRRLVFIVVIETIAILCILILISYQTIHSIEKSKLKTSMAANLQQITEEMTQKYKNVTRISQQMSPEGNIGSLLDSYFQENSNFDKYQTSLDILDNLVKITFANSDIILRTYFDPVTANHYFYNFLPSVPPYEFNVLKENGEFQFHSLHQSSVKSLGNYQVLSISRKITIEEGRQLVIYIESRMDANKQIEDLSKSQHMKYVLLQLDTPNRVQYSSSEAFHPGELFQMKDEEEVASHFFGKSKNYVGVRQETDMGFVNVLLLPKAEYNRELYAWIRDVTSIFILALLLLGISYMVLSRLILSPLILFIKEMRKIGRGDLETISVHSGVVEYDELFKQFNTMKIQIQKLLSDAEHMSREKQKLEIEKIYYQINPHFLMNALHSIHWLAKMSGQAQIETFITELNFILAYSLGKIDKQATLRTEVKMLLSYLKLQKMRYDFQVDVIVDEGEYLETPTARMILQPIAENAIHHGLGEEGCLSIRVSHSTERNAIIIIVEDNGKGLTTEQLESIKQTMHRKSDDDSVFAGIGLRYVHYMLESFYGDKAIITIDSELTRGTKVKLLLPIDIQK